MNKHKFFVSGTHCPSCKILIEDVLGEHELVEEVLVDLKNKTVEIKTHNPKDGREIATLLTEVIKPNGYTLSLEEITLTQEDSSVTLRALSIGLLVLALFFFLQKSGILDVGFGGEVTFLTSFLVGLIASVSSCLAIVGGLVLSLSAKISEDNVSDTLGHSPTGEAKTFILFHASRILGFAVLGGVLGFLGEAIGVNFTVTAILGLLASFVMIVLGLNLTGVLKRNRLTLSGGAFNFFRKVEHKTWAPVLVGVGTFFLPCGFTQSMQIAALSSGTFFSGVGIMLAFALGTLPMLALLSFGSVSFAHSRHAPLFFKTAGVVVLGLGVFAFLSGLTALGIINPIFNI